MSQRHLNFLTSVIKFGRENWKNQLFIWGKNCSKPSHFCHLNQYLCSDSTSSKLTYCYNLVANIMITNSTTGPRWVSWGPFGPWHILGWWGGLQYVQGVVGRQRGLANWGQKGVPGAFKLGFPTKTGKGFQLFQNVFCAGIICTGVQK